jgi:SAM-dependent methyltransferase
MSQDEIFRQGEGDRWFARNRAALEAPAVDWVGRLLDTLENTLINPPDGKTGIGSALDLGCANGWRLARLQERFQHSRPLQCVGVDISAEAIRDGSQRYPGIEFIQAGLSDIPLASSFDLVIVSFVLHWIDRAHLARTIAEIDRLMRDDGLLVICDFHPNGQTRTPYHHLPDQQAFTYKQDYPRLFETLGTYREIARLTFDTDDRDYRVQAATGRTRAVCSALRKSLHKYYEDSTFAPVAGNPTSTRENPR